MIKFLKNQRVIIILLLVSIVFIIPYLQKDFIIATGEFQTNLNPFYLNFFSTWNEKLNLGTLYTQQNNIFIYSTLWKFLSLFSFIIHPSVSFMFLSYFLPSLFFYFCADKILKLENKLIYLPASLLYSYNVFRTLAPINERLNLLFIFLPIFFYFYFSLMNTKKWQFVYYIIILSITSSVIAGNLPLFTIPYILIFLYFLFYLIVNKLRIDKLLIFQNIVLIFFIFLSNLFWVLPLSSLLIQVYKDTSNGIEIFTALTVGNFYDQFRFIGSWAWKEYFYNSYYYPFFKNYYNFIIIITSFFISVVSYLYILNKKKSLLQIFILFSSLVSFLLLSGSKGLLNFIFENLYNNLPFFKIYRDPFNKFTPLYIFFVSFGLIFSISYLYDKIKNIKVANAFIFTITILILLNAHPLFNKTAIPIKSWNGGPSGFVIKIPSYWIEAKNYIENTLKNERLTIFPFVLYSTVHNWEYGTNIVGNASDFIIDKENIKAWDVDNTNSGQIIKSLTNISNKDLNLPYNLGLLNSRYILQENDSEWRYSGGKILPPSIVNQYLSNNGFQKIAEFGKFTPDYLTKILNKEKDKKIKADLYKELTNQPALVLYKSDDKYFLPRFYIPNEILTSTLNTNKLSLIVAKANFQSALGVYFKKQNSNNISIINSLPSLLTKNPTVEYEKINSYKYKIIFHNVTKSFPFIFSETYDERWKILSSQSKPLPDYYHLMANGYANSWYISLESVCINKRSNTCTKNSDGSYDIQIVVEYSLQKIFDFTFSLTIIIAVFSIFSLIIIYLKNQLFKNKSL